MAKIQNHLKAYNLISKDLDLLKSSGHFSLIYHCFLSSYECIGSAISKENLKVISSEIIDSLWTENFEFIELSQLQSESISLYETLNRSSEKKRSMKSPNSSRVTTKPYDFSMISDFSYTHGPGTFSKEKRTSKIEISPGPSDYNVNVDKVKAKSPSYVLSKTKKQDEFNSESPGPGSYFPLYHFRSR